MKHGLTQILPIRIGMDISLCKKVEFIFVQGNVSRLVTWEFDSVADDITQRGERTFDVVWTNEQIAAFDTQTEVELDTRITLKDTEYQPETEIVAFYINKTLFE